MERIWYLIEAILLRDRGMVQRGYGSLSLPASMNVVRFYWRVFGLEFYPEECEIVLQIGEQSISISSPCIIKWEELANSTPISIYTTTKGEIAEEPFAKIAIYTTSDSATWDKYKQFIPEIDRYVAEMPQHIYSLQLKLMMEDPSKVYHEITTSFNRLKKIVADKNPDIYHDELNLYYQYLESLLYQAGIRVLGAEKANNQTLEEAVLFIKSFLSQKIN